MPSRSEPRSGRPPPDALGRRGRSPELREADLAYLGTSHAGPPICQERARLRAVPHGPSFRYRLDLEVSLAALAFSICTSAVYILNDLAISREDRPHATSATRPLASGAIPLAHGVAAVPLSARSRLLATALSSPFFTVLAAYLVVTTAYTLVLKRLMLVDVITLGGLYSLRVIAGAAALAFPVSPWLIAFCDGLHLARADQEVCRARRPPGRQSPTRRTATTVPGTSRWWAPSRRPPASTR